MRLAIPATALCGLVVALWLLWNHRYETVPGLPQWRLAELRVLTPPTPGIEWAGTPDQPVLRLIRQPGAPPLALRLALPGIVPVAALHVRQQVAARSLVPGAEEWETGRMMIEWHQPGAPAKPELDLLGGAKLEEVGQIMPVVAVPERAPAVPALRIEHLGRSGVFEIRDLQLTVVEERALWRNGRWLLAAGFFTWLYVCFRRRRMLPRWRALAAAAVWLAMGIFFVVPGPWKSQRALARDFNLGSPSAFSDSAKAPPLVAEVPPAASRSGAIPANGKIDPTGGVALRVKVLLKPLRPLLHVLLIAAPALAFFLLLGRTRAAVLAAASLVLAMEISQTAFGYGFGWDDILDLATDSTGIALAAWLHRAWSARAAPPGSGRALPPGAPVNEM